MLDINPLFVEHVINMSRAHILVDKWQVFEMTLETLGEVASWLQELLESDTRIIHVILSTNEGIVVTAVSKQPGLDPQILSTVSAAINSASSTTLNQIGAPSPEYLIHTMSDQTVITVIQSYFSLIVVYGIEFHSSMQIETIVAQLNSLLLRIELLISSSTNLSEESLLTRILAVSPKIKHALLLTADGLPLSSVGFGDTIKLAGLVSSIFANGMTLSMDTEILSIGYESGRLIIIKIDDSRLLAVLCSEPGCDDVVYKIQTFLETSI